MKKQLTLLLTGLLALSLCACKSPEPEVPPMDVTPEVENTAEPASTPAATVASTREPQISHIIMLEGMEEEITSTLQVGEGYSFYLPDDDWVSAGPAHWEGRYNEEVQCWVEVFDHRSAQEVEADLTAQGYAQLEDGLWEQQNADTGFRTYVHVLSNDSRTVTFNYSYYYSSEMVEGWGTRLPYIAESFLLEP